MKDYSPLSDYRKLYYEVLEEFVKKSNDLDGLISENERLRKQLEEKSNDNYKLRFVIDEVQRIVL